MAGKLFRRLHKTKIRRANSSSGNAATELTAKALRLSSELSEPRSLNRGNLHSYRIKIKKLHYLIQFADGDQQKQLAASLRSCQRAIGEWHDFEELVSIAKAQLNHGPGCRLLPALRKISRQKFAAALSLTGQLRRAWTEPRHQPTRPGKLHRSALGRPDRRAVSTIAS